jgi:hypothetical protein
MGIKRKLNIKTTFKLILTVFLIFFVGCVITKNYKYVNRIGEPAEAVVLDISDTGITINDNPKVRLKLRVYPKDREPYEATVSQVVSRVTIPRVGDRVYVKFDPNNPGNVILLYEKDSDPLERGNYQ